MEVLLNWLRECGNLHVGIPLVHSHLLPTVHSGSLSLVSLSHSSMFSVPTATMSAKSKQH